MSPTIPTTQPATPAYGAEEGSVRAMDEKPRFWSKTENKVGAAMLGSLVVFGAVVVIVSQDGPASSDVDPTSVPTALEVAVKDCGLDRIGTLGDAGGTLTIDARPGYDLLDGSRALCALNAVDVPDSVISQVENTTSLQGRQSAEWDGYEASWTYHPDNGLDLIVTEAD